MFRMIREAPAIPGFTITGVVGIGATSVVYRATRDNRVYAIKVIKAPDASAASAAAKNDHLRFLREAATIAKLNHSGLVKIHETGEIAGRPYLVMELVEGETLKEKIARGPLADAEVLKLAGGLASILDYIHCRGVVHKDLKPENIMFDSRGGFKIIDLGLAVDAESFQTESASDDEAIGTLQYAAPEQTGMLKRPVDPRSDLYALGGVLYHCATGRLVFQAASAAEFMSRHLTEMPSPTPLLDAGMRPALAAMILKLLNKDPDDRYQSAYGFRQDLENLDEIEREGQPYRLAQHDTGLRTLELPLVGRDEELAEAIRVCDQLRVERGSVLLIEGEGGGGKTRLVRELLSRQKGKGYFILTGKAKQGEMIPFGPLREAIDSAIARAQRESERERDRIVGGIRAAAGDLAAIIRRLSPGLRNILSDARDIPPLEGKAEQDRFYLKIAEFFLELPKYFGPVIFLLDDVQWLDDGTLEILRQLAGQVGSKAFLVAATSRNDSISESPLAHFLDVIKDAPLTRIALKPLSTAAIEKLVTLHLGGKPLEPVSLKSIASKANGNPFAIGEYVRALLDRGMLKPTEDVWVFDSQHFHELQLPDDVIQLLINRMSSLTPEAAKTLSVAALIGYEFDIELLTAAASGHRETVDRAVVEGLQSGLIERSDRGYSFIHDRVSEALIESLPAGERQKIHQSLAEALDRGVADSSQKLYALARHYYLGLSTLHPDKVYQTSLAAGLHALSIFANEEAYEFLNRAKGAMQGLSLTSDANCQIHEAIGIACTRTGRLQEAVQSFHSALAHVFSEFDQARVHYLLGLTRASEGRCDLAKIELFKALDLLDLPFPKTRIGTISSLLRYWVAAEFRVRSKIGFGRAVGEERRRRELIAKINFTLNLVAYLSGDELLMVQSMVRALHNVQFLGACAETAKAHSFYCFFLGILSLRGMAEKHGQLAISMAQKLDDQEAIATCELGLALALEFSGDVLRGYQMLDAVAPKVLRYCGAWEKASMIGQKAYRFTSGRSKESVKWLEQMLPTLRQTGDLSALRTAYSTLYGAQQMLGNTADALRTLKLRKAVPDEVSASPFYAAAHRALVIKVLWAQEDFGQEIEQLINELSKIHLRTYHDRFRFALIGFVRLEQFRRATDPQEKSQLLAAVREFVKKSAFPNVLTPLHLCLHHALKGGWFILRGKFRQARASLIKAEQLATVSDNRWAQWLITREWARLAVARGDRAAADFHALRALKLAGENGWPTLSKQIQREFQVKIATEDSDSSRTRMARNSLAERHAEALLQINLASASSLDPHRQSNAILDELVRVLGAERAFLFVDDPARPGQLLMRGGRDSAKNDIVELKGYSSTVVNKVCQERKPLILSGTDEGEVLGAASVVAHNLRSIMAVPVHFREKFMGVIYLDSAVAKGIFTAEDLEFVTALANHIAIALETVRNTQIEFENLAMKKDFEVTSAVQSLILPKQRFVEFAGGKMAAFYKAANQTGGDWWWYDYDNSRSVLSVLMGDVTGHGAGPAMISAAVSGVYQAFQSMRGQDQRLPDFMRVLNESLYKLAGKKYLVSMNGFELDLATGRIDYWSAGAPPLWLIRRTGESEPISEVGGWLGTSEFEIGHGTWQLEPGTRIAIFTDGLFEVETIGDRELGLRRPEKLFKQTLSQPVDNATTAIIDKINEIRVPSKRDDDISLVLIDFIAPASSMNVASAPKKAI